MGVILMEPQPRLPPWVPVLRANLRWTLARLGYDGKSPQSRWAEEDLENGWPYGVIVGALEATRQDPPVSYNLAKVNHAHVALMQLQELQRTGVI